MDKANKIIDDWIKLNDSNITLNLNKLGLTSLPTLPPNVVKLECIYNNLTSLPDLPNSLTELYCHHNKLTHLPDLPSTLKILYCNYNEITSLPELPHSLEKLDCGLNILTNLPVLPNNLKYFNCSWNPINLKNIDMTGMSDERKQYLITQFSDEGIIDINKLNLFYKDNIDKCFMSSPVNYPINHSNLKLWLDKIIEVDDPILTEFGYEFTKTLTHISFNEFYDSCCKLSFNILETINNLKSINPQYKIIILINNINHSQFWVLMLLWKFIRDKVDIISYSLDDLWKYVDIPNNKCNYYLFYLDDCSYSGNQIYKTINYKHQYYTKFKYVYHENIYICCPYISVNAKARLEEIKLKILYTHLIPNFKLNKKMLKYNYLFLLEQSDNICNIYFDHKLASGVSTFQGIIAFGLYYTKNEAKKPIPLIRGCEDVYTTDKIKLLYDGHFDLQTSLKNMCPPAFYKTIEYSIKDITELI